MDRQFSPTSKSIRLAFAFVAVLATVAIAASLETLIDHYHHEAQAIASQPPVVAQR